MSDNPNTFETIERHEKGDKSGYHEFINTPDWYHPTAPAMSEFAFKAGAALREFRDQWLADHKDDTWAKGLEIDCVPIMSDGMVTGYLGISEIDGVSYDLLPVKSVSMNGEKTGEDDR